MSSIKPPLDDKDEDPLNFRTSKYDPPEQLKRFFQKQLKVKFNKYCIDCKKNLTEYCVLPYGSYVCKACVEKHI